MSRARADKKSSEYVPRKCVDVTISVDVREPDGKKWKATRTIRMKLRRNWERAR